MVYWTPQNIYLNCSIYQLIKALRPQIGHRITNQLKLFNFVLIVLIDNYLKVFNKKNSVLSEGYLVLMAVCSQREVQLCLVACSSEYCSPKLSCVPWSVNGGQEQIDCGRSLQSCVSEVLSGIRVLLSF